MVSLYAAQQKGLRLVILQHGLRLKAYYYADDKHFSLWSSVDAMHHGKNLPTAVNPMTTAADEHTV